MKLRRLSFHNRRVDQKVPEITIPRAPTASLIGPGISALCLRCCSSSRPAPSKAHLGIEPTTCRLRARILPCSAVLDIALSCLFLHCYSDPSEGEDCRDCPVLPVSFKHVPYKSPYSVFAHFSDSEPSCLEGSKQASLPLPAFALGVACPTFPESSRADSARLWAALRRSFANAGGRHSATASRC